MMRKRTIGPTILATLSVLTTPHLFASTGSASRRGLLHQSATIPRPRDPSTNFRVCRGPHPPFCRTMNLLITVHKATTPPVFHMAIGSLMGVVCGRIVW